MKQLSKKQQTHSWRQKTTNWGVSGWLLVGLFFSLAAFGFVVGTLDFINSAGDLISERASN